MALIKNSVMGNYDAILAAAGGVEGMGTVWNSWQTNWTGEPIVDSYWTREWVGEGQPDEHVTPDAQSTGFKGTPDFEP